MSRPPIDPKKTAAGIALDPQTLDRVVPESRRPDGTVRKQLRIRPGFTPQEDVQRFRGTKQAQIDAISLPKGHIVGWVPPSSSTSTKPLSKSAKKNAKRKEKREKEQEEAVSAPVPDNWDDDDEPADASPPVGTDSDAKSTPASSTEPVDGESAQEELVAKLEKLDVN